MYRYICTKLWLSHLQKQDSYCYICIHVGHSKMTLKGLSRDPLYIHVYTFTVYIPPIISSPFILHFCSALASNQLYLMIQNMLMKSYVQSDCPCAGGSACSTPHFGSDVYSFRETIYCVDVCTLSHTPYSYKLQLHLWTTNWAITQQLTVHISAISACQRQA